MNQSATSFMAYTAPDESSGWLLDAGPRTTGVTGDGDLVFNLRDALRVGELVDDGLLEQWAYEWQLSLDGIDQDHALSVILTDLALATALDLLPESCGLKLVSAFETTRSASNLPNLPVRVNGASIAAALIRTFDGPFATRDAFLDAAAARIALARSD